MESGRAKCYSMSQSSGNKQYAHGERSARETGRYIRPGPTRYSYTSGYSYRDDYFSQSASEFENPCSKYDNTSKKHRHEKAHHSITKPHKRSQCWKRAKNAEGKKKHDSHSRKALSNTEQRENLDCASVLETRFETHSSIQDRSVQEAACSQKPGLDKEMQENPPDNLCSKSFGTVHSFSGKHKRGSVGSLKDALHHQVLKPGNTNFSATDRLDVALGKRIVTGSASVNEMRKVRLICESMQRQRMAALMAIQILPCSDEMGSNSALNVVKSEELNEDASSVGIIVPDNKQQASLGKFDFRDDGLDEFAQSFTASSEVVSGEDLNKMTMPNEVNRSTSEFQVNMKLTAGIHSADEVTEHNSDLGTCLEKTENSKNNSRSNIKIHLGHSKINEKKRKTSCPSLLPIQKKAKINRGQKSISEEKIRRLKEPVIKEGISIADNNDSLETLSCVSPSKSAEEISDMRSLFNVFKTQKIAVEGKFVDSDIDAMKDMDFRTLASASSSSLHSDAVQKSKVSKNVSCVPSLISVTASSSHVIPSGDAYVSAQRSNLAASKSSVTDQVVSEDSYHQETPISAKTVRVQSLVDLMQDLLQVTAQEEKLCTKRLETEKNILFLMAQLKERDEEKLQIHMEENKLRLQRLALLKKIKDSMEAVVYSPSPSVIYSEQASIFPPNKTKNENRSSEDHHSFNILSKGDVNERRNERKTRVTPNNSKPGPSSSLGSLRSSHSCVSSTENVNLLSIQAKMPRDDSLKHAAGSSLSRQNLKDKDAIQKQCVNIKELIAHESAIICIEAFGDYIYTGSTDTTAKRFNLTHPEEMVVYRAHTMPVVAVQVYEYAHSIFVCTAGQDGDLFIFEANNGFLVHAIASGHPVVAMCKSWNNIYLGLRNGEVSVYNIVRKTGLKTLRLFDSAVSSMTTATQGARHLLGVISHNGLAAVYDATTNLLIRCLQFKFKSPCSIKIHDDMMYIATSDQCIHMYGLSNGLCTKICECPAVVTSLCIVNGYCLTSSYDGKVRCFKGEKSMQKTWSLHSVYCSANKIGIACMTVHNNWVFLGSCSGTIETFYFDPSFRAVCLFGNCSMNFGRSSDVVYHLREDHLADLPQSHCCAWRDCNRQFPSDWSEKDKESHILEHGNC